MRIVPLRPVRPSGEVIRTLVAGSAAARDERHGDDRHETTRREDAARDGMALNGRGAGLAFVHEVAGAGFAE